MQCFECKEFGHIASHCKKRNYYVYCNKSGHIVTECRELQQKGSNRKKNNHHAYRAAMTSSFSNESNSEVKSDINFPNATNNVGFI